MIPEPSDHGPAPALGKRKEVPGTFAEEGEVIEPEAGAVLQRLVVLRAAELVELSNHSD